MHSLLYIVVIAAWFADAKQLPSYIEPCKKDDPNLNECTKQHAVKAIPRILKGDKEYKIPVLLPLHIAKIVLNPSPEFTLKLTNVSLYGLDTFQVEDTKVDLDKQHAEIRMTFKSINLIGQYDMNGRILILPIKGTGPANISCDNLVVDYSFDYKTMTKNGKEYIDASKLAPVVTYTVKKINVKFDNLFNGDKNLGERTNEFLNENINDINEDFSSSISETIKIVANDIIKKIVPVVPYDQIFI